MKIKRHLAERDNLKLNFLKNNGFVLAIIFLGGCMAALREPIRTEEHVDLARFMGDWYVIANIPTFVEKGAHNAVESYKMNPDGT